MITVSNELKAAFLLGNQKNLTLTFSDGTQQVDEDIYLESMKIEQSLCEERQLTYGTASSSSFKIRLLNSGKSFKGLGVTVSISTVGDDEETYSASLGRYKVYEDVMSDDRNYRDLRCYDAFYEILSKEYKDWYNRLSFPMTMGEFRNAFFTHVGLTQRTAYLACDGIMIPANTVDSISGATIIQSFCEPSGAFCFIDYDGYVQYVVFGAKAGLYPRDDLYPADDLYPRVAYDDFFGGEEDAAPVRDGTVYADYNCRRITQVTVARSSEKEYVTVGEPGNTYVFSNNPLLAYMDRSTLESIGRIFIDVVQEVIYKPAKVKGRARVWIQPGDMMGVMTQSDRLVFPILHREMYGITALYDTYEAKGKEYYEFDANSLETRLSTVEDDVKDNSDDIDYINEEIDNPQTGIKASIRTNADNIALEVSNRQSADASLSSSITLTQNEIRTEVTNRQNADITLQSSITQNANQIALKVSKGDVSSQLSVETDQITISSNRLVINSTNFQLDRNGNATIGGNSIVKSQIDVGNGAFTVNALGNTKVQSLAIKNSGHINFMRSNGGVGVDYIYVKGANGSLEARISTLYAYGGNVITSNNIGSQSVSYAKSAGSVSWKDVSGRPSIPSATDDLSVADYIGNGNAINFAGTSGGSRGATIKYVDSKSSSDIRLKVDVGDLQDISENYMKLKPKRFKFNPMVSESEEKNHQRYGLIAQDVQGIDNDLIVVRSTSSGTPEEKLCGKYQLNINYQDLHAWHIQMIQSQQKKIEELEQRISVLEGGEKC